MAKAKDTPEEAPAEKKRGRMPHVDEGKDMHGKVDMRLTVAHALQAISLFLLGEYELVSSSQSPPDENGVETLTFKRKKIG